MGQKRAFLFLLLTGALLLAAAATLTAATSWDTKDFVKVVSGRGGGGEGECQERWCERRHRGDWYSTQRCLEYCKSREREHAGDVVVVVDDDVNRHGHDRGQCQKLCSHFHDYHRKMVCLQRCLHGLQAVEEAGDDGSRDAVIVIDDVNRHGHDRGQCQKLCSHFHDYHRKLKCMQRCLHGLLAEEDAVVDDVNRKEVGDSRDTIVVDDVNRHGHHDPGQCQKLCSHFHDYHRKMVCLQRCLHGLQQAEEDGGIRDADVNEQEDGVVVDVNRHGHHGHDRGQCQKLCSHFHDYHRKMQCLQRCLHGPQQEEEDGGSRDAAAVVVDDVNRQEDGVSLDDDVNRHGHDRGQCQKLCSHFHDYHRKMECLRRCLHGLLQAEEASVHVVDDDNSRGLKTTTVVGAILEVV